MTKLIQLPAALRAEPSEFNLGFGCNSSIKRLSGESLKLQAEEQIRHIPWKGTVRRRSPT